MSTDRTKEFAALAQSFGYIQEPSHHTFSPLTATASFGPLSDSFQHGADTVQAAKAHASAFTRAASAASSELHMTSMKIAKLTKLVRRRGMFDGDAGAANAEIDSLTVSIKQDVQRLNATLDALQSFVDARKHEAQQRGAQPGQPQLPAYQHSSSSGGGSGANGLGQFGRGGAGGPSADYTNTVQGIAHSDAVLAGLKGTLLSFGSELKQVVTLRSESLKAASTRRQQFGASGTRDLGKPLTLSPSPTVPARAAYVSGQAAPGGAGQGHSSPDFTAVQIGGGGGGPSQQQGQGAGGGLSASASARRALMYGGTGMPASSGMGTGTGIGMGSSGIGGGMSAAQAFGMVDQAQLQAEGESAYLQGRAQEVQAIESSIAELGTMFSRLAHLVAEQGSAVQRIEDNMDDAAQRMEQGEGELRRNLASVSSSRNLALKMVTVVVAAAIGFSVFAV